MTSLAERAAKMSPHGREVLARELIRAGTVFPVNEVAEPVAVVGIGCRFPGDVTGPDSFWRFLVNGVDGITEVPPDRWDVDEFYDPDPLVPDRMTTKWGGFISDVAGFDADFFGISPREAAAMDPQHRLLLEVSWEALEHAGIAPDSLSGSRTGVMIGMGSSDYSVVNMERGAEVDAYMGTGIPHSNAVGRISYLLGLRGPAVAVDTACSSSLVALHLACQSLRLRESDLALAGGVQLTLSPFTSVMLSKLSALSPRGRCSTFDAGADGFVRGEGAGVVVLKRLADAVRDGDRVLAVVRGSAVNQDGRTNGLTAPNLVAQREVIADALRAAAVAPETVNYVEAHGTGTVLGDPIEFEALAATYGRGEVPCALGAVKTNLGHLEAAAGIAGLIKAVLVLQHGQIPPNLHFTRWNPAIDASATRLFVPTAATPWPEGTTGPRRAGVSSFGISGTNAHAVLEQGPDPVRSGAAGASPAQPAVSTLVITGKTVARVASMAGMLADWMDGDGADVALVDVAHAVNHHRAHHRKFATVCARDRGQAVAGLRALAAGTPADGVVSPHEGLCEPGTVFVYSGQGSQWAGMGRQLLADEPEFAAAVAELEPVFVEQVGFSLRQVLADGEPVVGDARVQPVLVGLQLALTELWRSYGVAPDAVIGHSVGEVSAAVVAGALTVAEGLRVVATRSRLMARLGGQGAVALLELDAEATEELIAGYPGVELAVYSSPRQTVVAGPVEPVDAVIAAVQAQHRFARRVNMEVASHTALMDPILPELATELADLAPKKPEIRFISTVVESGEQSTQLLDADYWVANVRRPVRLRQAIATAGAEHATFVEVSPHPQLTYAVGETLEAEGKHHHSVGTLSRDGDDAVSFHTSLNATHTVNPPQTAHPPEPHPALPTTPWHHAHHWVAEAATTPVAGHPLLGGGGVADPLTGTRVWERTLNPDVLWLGDHRVDDRCVLPAGVYAELALAAVTEAHGSDAERPWAIHELCVDQAMPLGDATVVVTRLSGDASRPRVEIRSGDLASGWTLHASATLSRDATPVPQPLAFDQAAAVAVDPEDVYRRLADAGRELGPGLRGIIGLSVSDSGAVRAEVRLPSAAKQEARRLVAHPAMVEFALQVLGAGAGDELVTSPVRIGAVRVFGDVAGAVGAVGALRPGSSADRFVGRVMLTGADGTVLLDLDEVELVARVPSARRELEDQLFELAWEPVELDREPGDVGVSPAQRGGRLARRADGGDIGAVLVVAEREGDELPAALRSRLSSHAARCEVVSAGDEAGLRAALTRKDVPWDAIVVVCPPRSADEARSEVEQLELTQSRVLRVAGIVKTLSQIGTRNSPRLWLVTRGAAQGFGGAGVSLAQRSVRGIARVLVYEHPELKTTVVDVEAEGTDSVDGLVAELLAGADHDEVALRAGQRFVHRMVRVALPEDGVLPVEARRATVDLATGAVRLQVDSSNPDGLTLRTARRTSPGTGEVEVRVTAAGLNPVGDCVGHVTEVGAGVDSARIGQRVIALGVGTVGSYVTTPADLVAPVPEGLSDGEAAGLAVAYVTAWHGLCEVGRLAPGERVLIQSAGGAVGLAAVAVAKMVGAQVFATAGSPAEREMLAALGADYVGDSQTPEWAEKILAATEGHGADVIVNSSAPEAISLGMAVLAIGGRFVELGEGDPHADARLGSVLRDKRASFAVVDLEVNLRVQPARYGRLLRQVLGHVEEGALQRLPVTEFGLADAGEALTLIASGHSGKVVIAIPAEGRIDAVAAAPSLPLVRADGGYIVVGGMGGLGLVVARWLAAQGAGVVVLNGRSEPGVEATAAIAEIREGGTRVEVVTGDIAEPDTAVRLVAAVRDAGLRPAGVLHSAMVLADEVVFKMTPEAAARVFAPKVAGGWWLHRATADLDLDWWLTFSTSASMHGSPGQAAYAAANSWLDGLVDYRRSLGLPAIGINWGPWAEVGRGQFFADRGFAMITPELGLQAMQLVLASDRAHTGVFTIDARQWFQSFPALASSSLFAAVGESAKSERPSGDGRIRAELDAAEPAQRPALLAAVLASEIQAVRRSTEPLEHDQLLDSLGLDSLMALELRNRLEAALGITLPAALVWAYPTICALAEAVCERMGYEPTGESRGSAEAFTESSLSEEESELLAEFVEASTHESEMGAPI